MHFIRMNEEIAPTLRKLKATLRAHGEKRAGGELLRPQPSPDVLMREAARLTELALTACKSNHTRRKQQRRVSKLSLWIIPSVCSMFPRGVHY
jgi:hypothetical protein